MKLTTRKLAALVTGLALAASSPVLVQADKGGVPNANSMKKPCPAKGKRKHKKAAPNTKGKKCGFAPGATTTTTASTPTTPTTPTTP